MNLNESHIRKSDPILLDRLMHAKEGEVLRVAMTLNAESLESGKTLTLPTLDPAQFPSRVDYRQALIQQQQARLATALGATMQELQDLSLKTYGGNTSRVIIAEGTAGQIIKSLELVGVHHASFDQSIGMQPSPLSNETMQAAEYLTSIVIEIFKSKKGNDISKYVPEDIPNRSLIYSALEKYIDKYKTRYCFPKVLGMRKAVKLESIYTDVRLLNDDGINQFISAKEIEIAYRKQNERRFQNRNHSLLQQNGIDVANQKQFLIVLGAPGAGKSTFLRRIGIEALKGQSQLFKHKCVTILIELKQLNLPEINLEEFIVNELQTHSFPCTQQFIMKALYHGQILVLLDGLDEVSTQFLSDVVNKIRGFVKQYPRNRYILSCRTAAYQQEFREFTNVTMAEFEDDQIQQFIHNWFQSEVDQQSNVAERCWNALQESEQRGAKELAHTPLLLTFLCLVYDHSQTFPINRSVLYRKALRILMEEWAAEKRILQDAIYKGLNTELEEVLLSEIAASGFEIDQIFFTYGELIKKVNTFLKGNLNTPNQLNGKAILNAIVIQQGILVERAEDAYSFSHLTIQEYLTAQYIIDHDYIERLVVMHLNDRRWREVFLLVAGLMRSGADTLLLLMEKQVQKCICSNNDRTQNLINKLFNFIPLSISNLQKLLQWADKFTASVEVDGKQTTAIFFALAFNHHFILDDISHTISSVCAHNSSLGNALSLALPLSLSLSRALDDYSSLDVVISITLKVAHGCEKMGIFQLKVYLDLVETLEILQSEVQGKNLSYQKRNLIVNHIQSLWFNALQLNPEILDLSKEDIRILNNYFYVYAFMAQCKDSAIQVSLQNWSEIEERMLRMQHEQRVATSVKKK